MSLINCFDKEDTKHIKEPTKRCIHCGEEKPLSHFHVKKNNPDGRDGRCKPCKAKVKRVVENLKKTAPTKPCQCEICGKEIPKDQLRLDHDHKTGEFRGWLCNTCNTAIGFLGDDSTLLRKAVKYIERKKNGYLQRLASLSPIYKSLSSRKRK